MQRRHQKVAEESPSAVPRPRPAAATDTTVAKRRTPVNGVVSEILDGLRSAHLEVLHDRSVRRPDDRRATPYLDHLVIARTGVWVVATQTHEGTFEVRRTGGLVGPRTKRLFVDGRDRTPLLEDLARRVAVVQLALAAAGAGVPVHGALCVVGTELSRSAVSIGRLRLVGPHGLAALLQRRGRLGGEDRAKLAMFLARQFPVVN